MNSMFNGCKIFTGKGLENWNVSNVSNIKFMFVDCEKFNHNLSNWNIKNIQLHMGCSIIVHLSK